MGLDPAPDGDMFTFFGEELEDPWCTGEDLTCAPPLVAPPPPLLLLPPSENFLLSALPPAALPLLLFDALVAFFDLS